MTVYSLLWTSPYSTNFSSSTFYAPIGGYDAVEILYEDEISGGQISTSNEIPIMDEYTSYCNLFRKSGEFGTNITFSKAGTFNCTFNDNTYCTPKFIYGIKRSPTGKLSYTNVLDSVGYQTDKAISDGSEVDNPGTDLTGRIAVKVGDIIRLKNVTMPDVEGYENKVYGYKSGGSYAKAVSVLSTGTEHSPVFENGNLVQFTVTNYILNAGLAEKGYIRIGAANIDTKSIITVNELIEL